VCVCAAAGVVRGEVEKGADAGQIEKQTRVVSTKGWRPREQELDS